MTGAGLDLREHYVDIEQWVWGTVTADSEKGRRDVYILGLNELPDIPKGVPSEEPIKFFFSALDSARPRRSSGNAGAKRGLGTRGPEHRHLEDQRTPGSRSVRMPTSV